MKTISVPACIAQRHSFLLLLKLLSVFLLHLNPSIPQLVPAFLPLGGTFTHVTEFNLGSKQRGKHPGLYTIVTFLLILDLTFAQQLIKMIIDLE